MIGGSTFSGCSGGNALTSPLSFSMVVVTKKKISSKNAMSAIDPALISGAFLLAIIIYLQVS